MNPGNTVNDALICCYSLLKCASAYHTSSDDDDHTSDDTVEKTHEVVIVDEESKMNQNYSSWDELDFYLWTQDKQCAYVFSLSFFKVL